MGEEKITFKKRAKGMNRKALMSSLSTILVAVFIIASTLVQAGFDPEYLNSPDFVANLLITLSICLIGMANGNAEGTNYYKNKVNGLYQVTCNEFKTARKKINPYIDKFSYWSENLYKKELYKKQFRYLKNDFGIKQAEKIMKLDRSEIVLLVKPQKFGDTYFNSLNEEQIKACLNVAEGKVKLRYIEESYFLNVSITNKNQTTYEWGGLENKNKTKHFTKLTAYRLLTTITIGVIFGGLVVGETASVSQVWVTLVARLWTLSTSIMWGVFISSTILNESCSYISYKTRMLDTFYLETVVNKTFNSKTQEEIAKEEYEKTLIEGKNTISEKEINYGAKE